MATSSSNSSGGTGVLGLLGICFIVLKLTGFISWSWWLVLAPFWGGFALVMTIIVCIVCIIAVGAWTSSR